MNKSYNNKNWYVLLALSFFAGGLGADRFYVGKVGTGVLKLLTLGGLGVWSLVDFILVLTNNLKDKDGCVPKQG